MTTVLVTGVAGFIGSQVAASLLKRGDKVVGVDNLNDYYDVNLKKARLEHFFKGNKDFTFYKVDFSELDEMDKIFVKHKIEKICHLGAQAGVRYSLEAPFTYTKSNVDGTLVIFELARKFKIKHIVYASSSSVYGSNKKTPFSADDPVNNPISLYAATKRFDELMAHTYFHLFGIKSTGLRFFTVYGPWGRPDMALFKFTKNILAGKEIEVYNFGNMKRDFTFITDIVDGVIRAIDKPLDCEILNLGNSDTVTLLRFIELVEEELGKKAKKKLMPMQPGDVPETFADIEKTKRLLGWQPKVKIDQGIKEFIEWYRVHYNG